MQSECIRSVVLCTSCTIFFARKSTFTGSHVDHIASFVSFTQKIWAQFQFPVASVPNFGIIYLVN